MNNTTKILTVAALAILTGTAVYAGPHHGRGHHHDRNNGVRLATDIVRLVKHSLNVATPRPVIVTPPAPVIVTPPPRRHYRPAPPPPPRHHHHGKGGRRR